LTRPSCTRSRFLHDPASLLGNDALLDQFVDRMHAIVDRRYRVGERVQRERGHQRRGGAAARARSIPRHPRHRVLGDGALHQSVLGRAQGHHFSRGRRSDLRQARRRVRAEHLQEEALESRGTDMVVSNKSKKSTAPRFIVDIAAGTCSCGEPQTVGTACVHALVAIEASTTAGARQLLKTNKFFAIGLRASDAAMAFDATAAAALSLQMKAGASVEWRHLQVSEQIVWPIAKRKRDDAAGDAPGDASTASTSTSTATGSYFTF
jgi:hypothetical protein